MKSATLFLMIFLLMCGCEADDRSESKQNDVKKTAVEIKVYSGSTEPTAIISGEQQIRSFLHMIGQAQLLPKGLAYTDDFFRTFTVQYNDGSTRTLSFHMGGGKVFSDSLDGKVYGIEEADKQRLQALVDEAERDKK
jgi:hypothetical protein